MNRDKRKIMLKHLEGRFEQLFEHSLREVVMPFDHIFKRHLIPLCKILKWFEKNGTTKDHSEIVKVMTKICTRKLTKYLVLK